MVIFFIVIILAFIILRLSFVANTTVYSNFHEINNFEWLVTDTLVFDFSNKNTHLNHYNITLFGKINYDYSYSNLYIFSDICVFKQEYYVHRPCKLL